jgi:hypothetical protein
VKLPFLEPDDDVVEYVYSNPGSRYNTRRAAASKGDRSEDSNYCITYFEINVSWYNDRFSLFAEELRKVFLKLLDSITGAPYSPDEFYRSVVALNPRFQYTSPLLVANFHVKRIPSARCS